MLHSRKMHQNFRVLMLLMFGLGILTIQASCSRTGNGLSVEENETALSKLSRTTHDKGERHLGDFLGEPEQDTQKWKKNIKETWRPCQKWLEISKEEVVFNEGKAFLRVYFRSNRGQNLDTMKVETGFYPNGFDGFFEGEGGKRIVDTHIIGGNVEQGEVFPRDFLLDGITEEMWNGYYEERQKKRNSSISKDTAYTNCLDKHTMNFSMRISVALEVVQEQIRGHEKLRNYFKDPSKIAFNVKKLSKEENADLVLEKHFTIIKGGESEEEKDAHVHDYNNDSFFDSKTVRSKKPRSLFGSTLFRSKKKSKKRNPQADSSSRSRRKRSVSSASSATSSFLDTLSRRNKNK